LVCDGDDVPLVEVAHGFLENFFAHLERALDVIGRALVSKWAKAVMALDPFEQGVGKAESLPSAGGLEHDVELAVGPHLLHVAVD